MTYLFGEFELEPLLFQIRRRGVIVKLEPKIFDVLAYLIQNRGRVVSKDELLEALWPGEFVSESVLPRCIGTARKALGDTRAKPTTIATVHGRGYRFVAEVREAEGPQVVLAPAARELPDPRASLFVGREDTLTRLRSALEEVLADRGRIVLLVGEPGIGKTRTAEELAAEARRRGARVVSARCYEGEGAPAYWPWVQILRGCIRGRDQVSLLREMGAGAADIGRLLPELAEEWGDPVLDPDGLGAQPRSSARGSDSTMPPEEARFQLFDSIATFLRQASRACPLVLLVDDLNWADKPSLLLLQYLAREMRESRLLLLGTYRDVELRRQHPLVRLLGELAREPLCERLHLRGLRKSDVARFIEARAGGTPAEDLVQAVHEMTEGNPFFIGEIVGLLEAEGRLRRAAEPSAWDILLPQSVREAIGRRLDGLSAACNRVLAIASVVGRDFDIALLEHVHGGLPAEDTLEDSSLLERIDEAVSARIVTAESPALGRYAFSHALIRQTLYEELPIPQRLRLHQKVADVLEQLHAGDLEPHLSQIAHHLFQGAAAGKAAKAVDYAVRAARRAFALLAYEEAAVHYERALQLLDFHPGGPIDAEQRFEILLSLADAQSISGNRERSQENCRRASAIARKLGVADFLARAALVFGQRAEAGPLPAQEQRALLEEALAALGDRQPALRSRLLSRMSATPPYQDSIETRTAMSREAVELARQAGDQPALLDAMAAQLWALLGPDHDEERLRAADDLSHLVAQTGDRERLLVVQEHRSRSFLAYGDLAAADRETEVYERLAAELRQPSYVLFAKWYWVARALCDGRFAEGETLMRESFSLGQRLQHPATKGMLLWHVFWLLRQRGDLALYENALQSTVGTYGDVFGLGIDGLADLDHGMQSLVQQFSFGGPFVPSVTAYLELAAGREDLARGPFEALAERDFADIPRDEWWMPTVTHLAEMASALADEKRCRALYRLLEPFAERNAAHSLLRTYGGSTAHFLGLLAATLRRTEEAARHFETALAANAALGARPALVRTQCEYGRLLAARGRKGEARRAQQLVREALATATELGLAGLADRIQKEIINSS